jgi:hypothetical protein
MSENEIIVDETLEEDPAYTFANEMDLEFDSFCIEQLEKELSAGEPQLIPDDEMDDDLWVFFPHLSSAAQTKLTLVISLLSMKATT